MSKIPSSTSQWVLESSTGSSDLTLKQDIPLPPIGRHDVLVKIHAVALNSRDNQILHNTYLWGSTPGVVPLSDGAGLVIAVGEAVTRFTTGSRVAATFHRGWLSGKLSSIAQVSQIGAHSDGLLRQYIVFHEDELVAIPSNCSFVQASTLPCAALTAWNALFCGSVSLKPGDVVLAQGSGGVSLFTIQFSKAAGATVIATTGQLGGERERYLRQLGATTVLSYKDADWGKKVKAATGGRGVDFIVEVSGAADQCAAALRLGGQIAVVGGVGGPGGSVFDMRNILGELRRVVVGSREQFEDMNRAIEANDIQPVIDETVWAFEQAKEAFEYAQSGKTMGKVVIRLEDYERH
ncbi:chaperonin 10-like protein [Talaromyces proteolyticus]|uniref:Chaperonin 10-like protein n=1 Tax=Talaromyces proteolyticus TaxID=1131652 RepID=A0AAD4L0H3_9EURO|nr:chaperonin 10-like protein [Talaromyces proteolyticus]KAH8703471.1 chaperonin 10-like protein [Talaromyces proteolyticus]